MRGTHGTSGSQETVEFASALTERAILDFDGAKAGFGV